MGAMELDDFPTGELMRLSPLVGRVLAPNPSPFTYTGTQTYVVGQAELAVIDPVQDHHSHLEALLSFAAGRQLKAILCSHTHPNHSPARRPLQKTNEPHT